MLSNIRIVLVQTYHPGNIGSAARAMKTMGLDKLVLVNPRTFTDPETMQLAAGAQDIIANARIVDTLSDAVADCVQVIGASARLRSLPLPHYDEPSAMAADAISQAHSGPVALVFGRERSGLSKEEIRHCSHQVSIPANPDYGILNLSQAVQVLAYELYQAWRRGQQHHAKHNTDTPMPNREQLDSFHQHLSEVMRLSGFIIQPHMQTEAHLQALFARAQPTCKELNILRGVLAAVQRRLPTDS